MDQNTTPYTMQKQLLKNTKVERGRGKKRKVRLASGHNPMASISKADLAEVNFKGRRSLVPDQWLFLMNMQMNYSAWYLIKRQEKSIFTLVSNGIFSCKPSL